MKRMDHVNAQFFKELQQLCYEDEIRPKLLIYGVKRILALKQKKSFLQKMRAPKVRTKPVSWVQEEASNNTAKRELRLTVSAHPLSTE